MNKTQRTLIWIGISLLSLVCVIVGGMIVASAPDYPAWRQTRALVSGIVVMGAIPIVLIFGFAVIASKQR